MNITLVTNHCIIYKTSNLFQFNLEIEYLGREIAFFSFAENVGKNIGNKLSGKFKST